MPKQSIDKKETKKIFVLNKKTNKIEVCIIKVHSKIGETEQIKKLLERKSKVGIEWIDLHYEGHNNYTWSWEIYKSKTVEVAKYGSDEIKTLKIPDCRDEMRCLQKYSIPKAWGVKSSNVTSLYYPPSNCRFHGYEWSSDKRNRGDIIK